MGEQNQSSVIGWNKTVGGNCPEEASSYLLPPVSLLKLFPFRIFSRHHSPINAITLLVVFGIAILPIIRGISLVPREQESLCNLRRNEGVTEQEHDILILYFNTILTIVPREQVLVPNFLRKEIPFSRSFFYKTDYCNASIFRFHLTSRIASQLSEQFPLLENGVPITSITSTERLQSFALLGQDTHSNGDFILHELWRC